MSVVKPTETEKWRPVVGYEGFYEVSNLGRVKSWRSNHGLRATPKMLKPMLMPAGYLRVKLHRPGKNRWWFIHKLVLSAFVTSKQKEQHQGNHINGTKCDNRLENLEWCNPSENKLHSYRILGERPRYGAKNGAAKLDESTVREIFKLRSCGNEQLEIASAYGIGQSTVSRILNGRRWGHLAHGKLIRVK